MIPRRLLLPTVAGAFLLLTVSVLAVGAYEGQVPAQILLSGHCNTKDVTATVKDASGAPIAGVVVNFTLTEQADDADSLAPASDTTNDQGEAHTTLYLANVPGVRVIHAETTGAEASGSLTVDCGSGLPPTTAEADTAGVPLSTIVVVGLVFLVIAAAGFLAVRTVRLPRS